MASGSSVRCIYPFSALQSSLCSRWPWYTGSCILLFLILVQKYTFTLSDDKCTVLIQVKEALPLGGCPDVTCVTRKYSEL